MPIFAKMRLGTRFTIVLVAFFLISIGLSGLALYRSVRTTAEESVTSNGLLLLHTMNAVRNYTSSQVNPLLVPVMGAEGKFIPESVPAFSARSVFDQVRANGQYQNFFYKEASTNPTAPEDRADELETQVPGALPPRSEPPLGIRVSDPERQARVLQRPADVGQRSGLSGVPHDAGNRSAGHGAALRAAQRFWLEAEAR